MANRIGWCEETINPVIGCSKVSAGCDHCYAEVMARRLAAMGCRGYSEVVTDGRWNGRTALVESELRKPEQWKAPRRIFVCSMADLFHESVPDEWIDAVFAMAALNEDHTFLILTKRADRMKRYVNEDVLMEGVDRSTGRTVNHWFRSRKTVVEAVAQVTRPGFVLNRWPLDNVQLGVTVENQAAADARIPLLLESCARVRFISVEPMLGPVTLVNAQMRRESSESGVTSSKYNYLTGTRWVFSDEPETWMGLREWDAGLDGVIVGGESGPGARPMYPGWVRQLRDECEKAGRAFYFKGWGEWAPSVDNSCCGQRWGDTGYFKDGRFFNQAGSVLAEDNVGRAYMHRVGKHRSGRLLDGVTHDALV